jgi:glycosyltransferase involved in cell wall biosynthesis
MKICFVLTRLDEFGGVQIHIRDLCMWYRSLGHTPIVIYGHDGILSEFLTHEGFELYHVPEMERSIRPFKDAKATQKIIEILKAIQPDLVSCHSSKAGIVGRLAAYFCNIPVIFTAHGWAFTTGIPAFQAFLYRIIETLAAKITDHIITVSEFDRDLAIKYKVCPPQKVTSIHNGMPDRPMIRSNNSQADRVRLLMVARIAPQKDHELLFEALSECLDLNWNLDLIGSGDDSELRKLAEHLGILERIHFLGERSDVPHILDTRADIFLLISKWEGFPRSILEAMRAGLPVIASDVGGSRESVRQGETGFVVPARDKKSLVDALRHLISDPALQEKMGHEGRRVFEQHFTFQAMASKNLALYQKIIGI